MPAFLIRRLSMRERPTPSSIEASNSIGPPRRTPGDRCWISSRNTHGNPRGR